MGFAGSPHRSTPGELAERLELERRGVAFLSWRDLDDRQRLAALEGGCNQLSIGRRGDNDIALVWDSQVSRVHAIVERAGPDWMIADAGLSQNGTWINGGRITGTRLLSGGDVLRVGQTLLNFHQSDRAEFGPTSLDKSVALLLDLTQTQRQVLVALCRPFADGAQYAAPATNLAIAAELFLSVEAVKSHLRTLFRKLAIDDLPQNQKRLQLAEKAMRAGLVTERGPR